MILDLPSSHGYKSKITIEVARSLAFVLML